jgi:hypothetical protein
MDRLQQISHFYSYPEFVQLVADLVGKGKTSGSDQSSSLIFFTKLNLQRFERWNKTLQLSPETISQLTDISPQTWWVINEAWCGDAAQTLPMINKIAEASGGKIDIRIILRDEHTDIMDQYLTNGGRGIPKLVAIDAAGSELFNWGPRPAAPQQMMINWKANNNDMTIDDVEKEIHHWYALDKGMSTETEIMALLNATKTAI